MNKKTKLFALAIVSNLVENIILLLFFGIKLTRQVFIGAGVFAFTLFLLNKIIMEKQ